MASGRNRPCPAEMGASRDLAKTWPRLLDGHRVPSTVRRSQNAQSSAIDSPGWIESRRASARRLHRHRHRATHVRIDLRRAHDPTCGLVAQEYAKGQGASILAKKGRCRTGRHSNGISTSVQLPGVAAFTAAAIRSMCKRTRGHCGVLNTTRAMRRPVRFC